MENTSENGNKAIDNVKLWGFHINNENRSITFCTSIILFALRIGIFGLLVYNYFYDLCLFGTLAIKDLHMFLSLVLRNVRSFAKPLPPFRRQITKARLVCGWLSSVLFDFDISRECQILQTLLPNVSKLQLPIFNFKSFLSMFGKTFVCSLSYY